MASMEGKIYPGFINVLRCEPQMKCSESIMSAKSMKMSRTWIVVLMVVALMVTTLGTYAALTFPRNVVSFPVSFTIGADVENREFEVPALHEWVEVEVVVSSGTSLWTAKILMEDDVLWSHAAHQGDQTAYKSGWIKLPSGHYTFKFVTAGLGSLDAEIKVTSKGGFW